MIQGIGVDIVTTKRFEPWLLFSELRLGRLFHAIEVKEVLEKKTDKALYLASRFAVKEAFFKALSAVQLDQGLPPFLTLSRSIYLAKNRKGVPQLVCESAFWQKAVDQGFVAHLSLSHEKEQAIAFVVIEQRTL